MNKSFVLSFYDNNDDGDHGDDDDGAGNDVDDIIRSSRMMQNCTKWRKIC